MNVLLRKNVRLGFMFLWLGLLLGSISCAPSAGPAPAAPTGAPTTTTQQAQAAISVSPRAAGPLTQVIVTGAGFPAGSKISVHLGRPNAGGSAESYGEAVADAQGKVTIPVVLPAQWANGSLMQERELVLIAATDDFRTTATASIEYLPGTPAPAQATSAAQATDAPATSVPALPFASPTAAATLKSTDANEAAQVVRDFLTSVQKDPSGKSSRAYLGGALVADSRSISALLGIQNIFPSFTLATPAPSTDVNHAAVRARLEFAQPVERVFVLGRENGAWKIQSIAPASAESTTPGDWDRVKIDQAGVSLEIPKGWARRGQEWAWAQDPTGMPRVGVNWNTVSAGWTPTGMLPNHSRTLKTEPVSLPWGGQGTIYTLEITAPSTQGGNNNILSVERHIILQFGGKTAVDLYAMARTQADLDAMQPVLQHMLMTTTLSGG